MKDGQAQHVRHLYVEVVFNVQEKVHVWHQILVLVFQDTQGIIASSQFAMGRMLQIVMFAQELVLVSLPTTVHVLLVLRDWSAKTANVSEKMLMIQKYAQEKEIVQPQTPVHVHRVGVEMNVSIQCVLDTYYLKLVTHMEHV